MKPNEVLDVVLKERKDGKGYVERIPSNRELGAKSNASSVVKALQHLSNSERLEVIEAAIRLVRNSSDSTGEKRRAERAARLREAAEQVKDLSAPGGELTEWAEVDVKESPHE